MAANASDPHDVDVPGPPFPAAEANVVDGGIHRPAPAPAHIVEVQGRRPGEWSTGLCGCFDDVGNCCITCCCPCVTFGQIAEIMDRGSSSCGASGALYAVIMLLTGCECIYSCHYRRRTRDQYQLEEGPCPDCVVHCCCEGCALCQEYRELRHRGFDMNIGWYAYVERQQQAAAAAAAAPRPWLRPYRRRCVHESHPIRLNEQNTVEINNFRP